ncbi:phosphotyrosine protein phosphatase [Niveispirillum lacus]|uniref:protein-tyrosine-phosphatase n=2 Tax=Niveispirillum lacus TaxID=1981099 RepID=A0A255YRI1_9PROT|nr:low molecular weight protein-tyrosine-phosphatase [Niveispirillum lacus]OYQ31837.1 phosphotyrosine protein phosphatase [Niveispirillum lacus]
MRSILFVCTGNICRSPTADGVLRKMAANAGLDLRVDSAGTHGYHVGDAPDPRTIRTARSRGYDLSHLRARKLIIADFDRFDLILAMDRGHLEIMRRLAPTGSAAQLSLFSDGAPPPWRGRDVPDPYYGGADGFVEVLDMVEAGVRALLMRFTKP